ncbi:hypothetical protein [Panacagrimonas perspica]|uniref:hypothetical protein n=1 Tax=Panacagrimonas perspica TaxID=381431 RepID=UPI001060087D|nr:hypothetical protein [Panacagrimonas perspica]
MDLFAATTLKDNRKDRRLRPSAVGTLRATALLTIRCETAEGLKTNSVCGVETLRAETSSESLDGPAFVQTG